MSKIMLSIFVLFTFTVALFSLTQTGTLIITVKSDSGYLLSGAVAKIKSDVQMGTRSARTGENGKAVFRNLAPGYYSITVTSDGFKTRHVTGIRIQIQKTTKVIAELELGEVEEAVIVVSSQELIDTSSNTVTAEFDYENYINHMPVSRHYTGIAGMAGGAIGSEGDPSVFGAGAQDNLYLIDGVLAIDSRTQTWGGQINIDTVQDMSLQTAGISAEYGHAAGSVFNIVTRSGSNKLHAVARLEMYRENWNDLSLNNPERTDDDLRLGSREDLWNFSGGGPVIKDKLWWFTSYTDRERLLSWQRRINPLDDGELTDAVTGEVGHYFSIKGTWQITDTVKGMIFYKEDPVDIGNAASYKYMGSRTQPEADAMQRQGGSFVVAALSWLTGADSFLELRWTDYQEELDVTAQEASPDDYWEATKSEGVSYISSDNWFWGVYPYQSLTDRNHDSYSAAFTWMIDSSSFLGEHDLKIGVEYLDEWNIIQNHYFPGGVGIFTDAVENIGFDNTKWIQKIEITNPLPPAEEHISYWTFYIQDSIKLGDYLTLNIGLRTDIASAMNNREMEIFSNSLFDALAPRVGLALALGKGSVYLSYGRYYDLFSIYLVDYFNTFSIPEVWSLYEPVDGVDGRNGWELIFQWVEGYYQSAHTIEDGLTPQYMDEISIGLEYPLFGDVAVGLNGVWRAYKDLVTIQDIDGDKKYNIENLETDAYGSKWKEHYGLVFSIRKRPADDFYFFSGSLTYSNTEGLCSDSLATGLSSYASNPLQKYDNAEQWWGPVPTLTFFTDSLAEPSLIGKAQGVLMLPGNIYIGAIATWHNGFQPTSYDETLVQGFGTVTTYPNGRGDMERLPDRLRIDLQIGIEEEVVMPLDTPLLDEFIRVAVYVNIYNLFNEQDADGIQQYIHSPKYGQQTTWVQARSYVLGFRLEF